MKNLIKPIFAFSTAIILLVFTACSANSNNTGNIETTKPVEETIATEESTTEVIEPNSKVDWGVTLSAKDVTSTGLTLVCTQMGGTPQGELQTGSYFIIEQNIDGVWTECELPPGEGELAWTMESWGISFNDSVEWEVDWKFLYGNLADGEYRIGKSIMDFIEPGNFTEEMHYANFTVESENIQVVNPLTSVNSSEDFRELGFIIDAPENSNEVKYWILSGNIAHIDFALEDNNFTLRASKIVSEEDLHGVYKDYEEEIIGIEVDGINYSMSIEVYSIENNGGGVATCKIDFIEQESIYITLTTTSKMSNEELSSIISDVANEVAEDNILT